jgi:hypothetical protein
MEDLLLCVHPDALVHTAAAGGVARHRAQFGRNYGRLDRLLVSFFMTMYAVVLTPGVLVGLSDRRKRYRADAK